MDCAAHGIVQLGTIHAQVTLSNVSVEIRELQPRFSSNETFIENQARPTVSMPTKASGWQGRARFVSSNVSTSFKPLGSVVLRPPEIAMQAEGSGGVAPLLTCEFDRSFFEQATGLSGWSKDILESCTDINVPRIISAMRSIAAELIEPGFSHEMAIDVFSKLILIDLARGLGRHHREGKRAGKLAGWQMRRIEDQLQGAEFSWPSLKVLADACGISEGHLSRSFHHTKGVTLREFAEQIRVRRAIGMLDEGLLAKEVAARLGFMTPSAFSVAFKRTMGMTVQLYQSERVRSRS